MTSYLVQTHEKWFIVEDKPTMECDSGWELSGDQVEIPYDLAFRIAKLHRDLPMTNGTVIDLMCTKHLF